MKIVEKGLELHLKALGIERPVFVVRKDYTTFKFTILDTVVGGDEFLISEVVLKEEDFNQLPLKTRRAYESLYKKEVIFDEVSYNKAMDEYVSQKKVYNDAREKAFLPVLEKLNLTQEKLNRLISIFQVLRDNSCLSMIDNDEQLMILETELLETLNELD